MQIQNPLEQTTTNIITPNVSIKYCLYARKSSESDEKQALSIDSQIKEMLDLAKRDGLDIVEIKRESHSAKETACRPVFNEVIKEIKEKKFNAIIAWHPDRLSRNAGDLGSLIDLMDQKALLEVKTYGQIFTNSPSDKFMLMILCSQAKLDNDNKSVNVKRGLRSRLEMGLWPAPAPTGYLNHPDRTKKCNVIVDPQRSHTIKLMFEMVAYEKLSGRQIYKWLLENQKFRTKNRKPLTLSNIYLILRNPFYCGLMNYPKNSDKWYVGKHEPIVTQELYKQVQAKLDANKSTRKATTKEFAFTRLMQCGLCGSGISAEEKFKNLSNGEVTKYVYYGCTKFHDKHCKNTYLNEKDLVKQLIEVIDQIDLDKLGIKRKLEKEFERFNRFREHVLDLTEEEKEVQKKTDVRTYARYLLKEGSLEEKRELMQSFKSKITMIHKKVVLDN